MSGIEPERRNPSPPNPTASTLPGIGADQALLGLLLLAGPTARPLERVRISPLVAGAMRAAIDVLIGELETRATLRSLADDGVLDLRIEPVDPRGIVVAGGVIETVEGSLAPVAGSLRQWSLRVPVLAAPESFLMFECGGVSLAIAWHAVQRVRMVRAGELRAFADHEGCGVVEPFGALDLEPGAEHPAILIGLGLRRAYLAAERLIWRMPAQPDPDMPTPPRAELGPALLTEEGARHWLLDPVALLRDVSLPEIAGAWRPMESADERVTSRISETFTPGEPLVEQPAELLVEPTPEPVVEAPPEPSAPPVLRLLELTAGDVEPLPASEESLPLVEIPLEVEPAAPPVMPVVRPLALVAEDSITARIFLTRLLDQLGLEVHAVSSRRELRRVIDDRRWAAVFVDIELPDASGREVFEGVGAGGRVGDAPVIALVRDSDDLVEARSAGVVHALRKPFEREHVEHLLITLGFVRAES
ncbi:MAG: response regulator [Candidatus Eisenbacteria bacterium]|uniref:Response regulator n=1 Tax=Eiseniibacteriota bacterium TaxID=2212470 RepID=A0A849STV4_UNCEI|nr:response regulator [Candidatus Eisenbacteria bacterium]